MLVGHPVDEGHHERQARREGAVVFAQSFDHPGVLLRHDLEHLDQKDHSQNQDHCGDDTASDHSFLTCLLVSFGSRW